MLYLLVENIKSYLSGRSCASNMEAWLVSNLDLILNSNDEAASQLANNLDADLMEMSEGLIDESTLKDKLQGYLQKLETIHIPFAEVQPSVLDSSESLAETITRLVEDPGPVVDFRLVHQFA